MSDIYGKTALGRAAQAAHDRLYPDEPHPMAECEDIALAVIAALRTPGSTVIERGAAELGNTTYHHAGFYIDDPTGSGKIAAAEKVFSVMLAAIVSSK